MAGEITPAPRLSLRRLPANQLIPQALDGERVESMSLLNDESATRQRVPPIPGFRGVTKNSTSGMFTVLSRFARCTSRLRAKKWHRTAPEAASPAGCLDAIRDGMRLPDCGREREPLVNVGSPRCQRSGHAGVRLAGGRLVELLGITHRGASIRRALYGDGATQSGQKLIQGRVVSTGRRCMHGVKE